MSQILDKISFNTRGGEYILRSTETLPVSYSDLVSKRNNGELVPGMWYRITDYRTTTTLENTSSAGHPFEILVQALTENTLSEDAKAYADKIDFKYVEYLELYGFDDNGDETFISSVYNESGSPTSFVLSEPQMTLDLTDQSIYHFSDEGHLHGGDYLLYFSDQSLFWNNYDCATGKGYFNSSNLSAWEIKYCLDNDTDRFAWADTDGYGVIYYMKDEFGNEAGYDFKNIQFKNLRRFSDSFVSKTNEDKIVDVEALDFSNSNWFTSDSVVMLTESNYKYTFSKGTVDASLNSTCRYNIIENTENVSESVTKQYLPFVVLESDTGAIHGNKCLLCPINIYVHVSGTLNHNTFDLHCKNVYICGEHLYDSHFSALLRMAFRGYTWDMYVQSCEDWVIWSSSHCKNNHFRGKCQRYKIVCLSMQNVHSFGLIDKLTALFPSAYLLAWTLYPYSSITLTGNATWIEKFTFMGSQNLTLDIDSGKVYSSIFYPGDYTDKTITEFNRTDSNADTGVTYEYKPNNSTTIMV